MSGVVCIEKGGRESTRYVAVCTNREANDTVLFSC
jgi:hypothetical protein